jgi:hypothetical protein
MKENSMIDIMLSHIDAERVGDGWGVSVDHIIERAQLW